MKLAILIASSSLLVIASTLIGCSGDSKQAGDQPASYVGREKCRTCHSKEYDRFLNSDHDLAMDSANGKTVLGNFRNATFTHLGITSRFYTRNGRYFVHTEGPGGAMGEFEIKYTFGIRPLQQYLVEFPGGRLQTLPLCWDSRPADAGGERFAVEEAPSKIQAPPSVSLSRIASP